MNYPDKVLGMGYVGKGSVPYRIIKEDKPHVTNDTENDSLLNSPFSKRERIKSSAGMPLISRGHKVGVMFVNYRKKFIFTNDELTNMELFANQAAVAIHNAFLFEHESEHVNTLKVLYDASRAVTSTLDLEQIFRIIAEKAYQITSSDASIPRFSYITWKENDSYRVKAAYPEENMSSLERKLRGIGFSQDGSIGINGRVFLTGEPALVDYVKNDPDYFLIDEKTNSQISVPIKIDQQVIGVISIEHTEYKAFNQQILQVLTSLADQACLAIRNAIQYKELRETRGIVGARTALAWMGMASSIWGHGIVGNAQTIRDSLKTLTQELQKYGVDDENIYFRVEKIKQKALEILEKPITLPLSVEEGMEPVCVNSFIKGRAKQLWKNEPHCNVDLNYDLSLKESNTIYISREWMRRVIDILLDNAVEAVENCERRVITVGTRLHKEGVCDLFVADTGRGIPLEFREKIMKDPIEESIKGMGMGLLMAQTIVQAYRGTILIDYTGKEGTCMVIRMPLYN